MNYNNAFSVRIPSSYTDPKGFYKTALMNIVLNKYPEITVEGLDCPFNGRTVERSGPNDVITFGKSMYHDMATVKYPEFYREDYDLVQNWDKVIRRIDEYANSKKYSNYYSKTAKYIPKVEVYDLFYKIGTTIIPRIPVNLTRTQISVVKAFLIEID